MPNLQYFENDNNQNLQIYDSCKEIINEKNKEISNSKQKISWLEEELMKINKGHKYLQKKILILLLFS